MEPARLSPEIESALASLDLTPIFGVAETETWMALSTSRDPETELRMFKSRNARVSGIAFALYAENEVFARRVVARALQVLEIKGVRTDGRWVGADVDKIQAVLFEVAASLGSNLITQGERLQRAILKVEGQAGRIEAQARMSGRGK